MSYQPGQTVYIDQRWPLKQDARRTPEGGVELFGNDIVPQVVNDALVIAALDGPVRETVKKTWRSLESKQDTRGTALLVLLTSGQLGWIKSDRRYPPVTSE